MSNARSGLAGVRVVLDDVRYTLSDVMQEPTTRSEWLEVIRDRARQGRSADVEQYLTAIAGTAPAGSPLAFAVADMRESIRRLDGFIPTLTSAGNSVPSDDDPDGVPQLVPTTSSATRYALLWAAAQGHLMRLSVSAGQPLPAEGYDLTESDRHILTVLAEAGRPLKYPAITRQAGYAPDTVRKRLAHLKRLGLVGHSSGYTITAAGRAVLV